MLIITFDGLGSHRFVGEARVQKREFDVALLVFQGIDIKGLTPRMSKVIVERTRLRKSRSKGDVVPTGIMSLHSVSLLIEAILLKARSLEELGRYIGRPICYFMALL